MLQWLYRKVLRWADHPYALYYLIGVSFTESFIFPIAPDVLLAPMVLNRPTKAWYYASLTTLASLLGGIGGYVLGLYVFEHFGASLISHFGYQAMYEKAIAWFTQYGVYAILIAGVTPVPYKIITIASGASHMAFLPFVVASLIGRGIRFFLVAGLLVVAGERLFPFWQKYAARFAQWLLWISFLSVCLLGYGLCRYHFSA